MTLRNAGLLEGVAMDPKAPAPRRVYADWWLEQGDPRGEYVSLLLAVDARVDPAKRKTFRAKAEQLFQAHQQAWLAPLLALGAQEPRFSRGFVEEITIDEHALGQHLAALLALEPITQLTVRLDDGLGLTRAMGEAAFDRIARLRLDGDADVLAEAPEGPLHTESLETVSLRQTTAKGVQALANRPAFGSLQRLSISGTESGAAGLVALGASPLHLRELYAARTEAGDDGVKKLLAGDVEALEVLCLGGNGLGDDALQAIADCARLKNLRVLELNENDFTATAVAALAEPHRLPRLKSLDLSGMWSDAHFPSLQARFRGGLRL